MKHFQRLTAMLLTLAMALTLLSGLGPVAARAEGQTDVAPEDARVKELASAKYDGINIQEKPYVEDDSVPKGFGKIIESEASTKLNQANAIPKGAANMEIGPMLGGAFSQGSIVPADSLLESGDNAGIATIADTVIYDNEEEAAEALKQAMLDRETAPVISFISSENYSSSDDATSLYNYLMSYAWSHTGAPNEGDYLNAHIYDLTWSGTYSENNNNTYLYELTFEITYASTASWEDQVDDAVDALLDDLNVYSASDYQKIRAIYDYICENVTFTPADEGTYYQEYSAYYALINGNAMCLGFSTLFYRLALELGVDARIVTGTAGSDSYTWNMVELDDQYYFVDAALDAGKSNYSYFLKCSQNMSNHTLSDTNANWSYPFATKDYAVPEAAGVAIDSTNFPDATFRSLVTQADADENGTLSQAELENIASIDVSETSIANLKGIEYFTELTYLNCGTNNLKTLDVSKNTKLTTLYCFENALTSLDVTKLTALTALGCSDNQIGTLDVSKNTKLEWFNCSNNAISSLDISKNTALYHLACSINQLTMLDVSKNTALEKLYCYTNALTSLDVTKNTALEYLNCYENALTSLNVSKNTALATLYCYENALTSLDITKLTALVELGCSNNQITSLDVSKNTQLEWVNCANNAISSLDVSKSTALAYLGCDGNQLTKLDLTKNTALETLYCYENALTSLNVSKCTALTLISCYSNKLTSLDVTKNTALEHIYCHDNQLTSLDISKNTVLTYLSCQRNQLTKLDVTKNTALIFLYTYNNPLASGLDVTKNTQLIELSCSNNNLTTLDVSKHTALVTLYCFENALTSLDLSKNTALEALSCFGNQLTSLDLSANTALETLDASDNVYIISLSSGNTFNLSSLPGNFQTSKASNWTNGTVSGSTLTVTDAASPVTYTYNCGNGLSAEFTLNTLSSASSVLRLAGSSRVETAIKVADAMKAELGVDQFSNIIVASGMNFADALAGSYLAAKKEAPILLYLDGNTANVDYIQNNLSSSGTVYILGGTSAVKQSFETDLTNAGIAQSRIKRLAGATRFETNLLILEEAGISSNDEILVATAFNFADCLSASATGQPILMVNTSAKKAADMLTDAQRTFLKDHADNQVVIIGGTSAVSDAMRDEIEQYLDWGIIRLSGSGREATSVEVAKRYFPNASFAVVAYSMNFPDGLCGGPLAYLKGAPLLLTRKGAESVVADYIKNNGITSGYVLGGTSAIPNDVAKNTFGISYSIPNA